MSMGMARKKLLLAHNPTLIPSTGSLLIYALDGTLKQSIPVPGGLKHIPTLADVRGLGRIDVVYRSQLGTVYVQNFGSTSTNLVSWATHRGNQHRDGNRGVSLFVPGTPLVTKKTPGYRRANFSWTNAMPASFFVSFAPSKAAGPFNRLRRSRGARRHLPITLSSQAGYTFTKFARSMRRARLPLRHSQFSLRSTIT